MMNGKMYCDSCDAWEDAKTAPASGFCQKCKRPLTYYEGDELCDIAEIAERKELR